MYVIMAFDKPDSEALRLENRNEHVAYVLGQDGVKTAGPFISDDGDTMIGTRRRNAPRGPSFCR